MVLPVTVALRRDETALSFASRMAAANGVASLNLFCAYLGLDLKLLSQADALQVGRLAALGGESVDQLLRQSFRLADGGQLLISGESISATYVHRQRLGVQSRHLVDRI